MEAEISWRTRHRRRRFSSLGSYEAKHLIIAALVDRVEVCKDREVRIIFKFSAEQYLGKITRIA